jgi:hypothetical protein
MIAAIKLEKPTIQTLHHDSMIIVNTMWDRELLEFMLVAPTFLLESPCIIEVHIHYWKIRRNIYDNELKMLSKANHEFLKRSKPQGIIKNSNLPTLINN